MRSMLTKSLLIAVLVTLVGGTSRAFAQDNLVADVPFKFIAAGRVHNPGKYSFSVINDDQTVAFGLAPKGGNFTQVVTRLAAPETGGSDGRLVFDKVGDTFYLSEMWIPGQDGFLLHAAKEKHTHHVIRLHRGGKTT